MDYQTELVGALQAIAESVDENEFDAIVEAAAVLIKDEDMDLDEAVSVAAALLYNENVIGDSAFAVTTTVLDEFANTVPATYMDAIKTLSENMSPEEFDQFMSEAVGNQLMNEGLKDGLGKISGISDLHKVATSGKTLKGYRVDASNWRKMAKGDKSLKDTAKRKRQELLAYERGLAGTTAKGLGKATLTAGTVGLAGYGLYKNRDKIKQAAADKYNQAKAYAEEHDLQGKAQAAGAKAKAAGQAAAGKMKDTASKAVDAAKTKLRKNNDEAQNESAVITLSDLRNMV